VDIIRVEFSLGGVSKVAEHSTSTLYAFLNFRTLLLTNIGTTNGIITDITDCCGLIITVGGVGGDFSGEC